MQRKADWPARAGESGAMLCRGHWDRNCGKPRKPRCPAPTAGAHDSHNHRKPVTPRCGHDSLVINLLVSEGMECAHSPPRPAQVTSYREWSDGPSRTSSGPSHSGTHGPCHPSCLGRLVMRPPMRLAAYRRADSSTQLPSPFPSRPCPRRERSRPGLRLIGDRLEARDMAGRALLRIPRVGRVVQVVRLARLRDCRIRPEDEVTRDRRGSRRVARVALRQVGAPSRPVRRGPAFAGPGVDPASPIDRVRGQACARRVDGMQHGLELVRLADVAIVRFGRGHAHERAVVLVRRGQRFSSRSCASSRCKRGYCRADRASRRGNRGTPWCLRWHGAEHRQRRTPR